MFVVRHAVSIQIIFRLLRMPRICVDVFGNADWLRIVNADIHFLVQTYTLLQMAKEFVENAIENANELSKGENVTTLEKISRANRWRIRTGQFSSDETDGFNGHFLVPLDGELWHVIISDGLGWRHLSVTNAQRKVLPSWNIMCRLKESFFSDEDWVCQYHPAKDDNINDHPFCLHLWQPLDEKLPIPPFFFV